MRRRPGRGAVRSHEDRSPGRDEDGTVIYNPSLVAYVAALRIGAACMPGVSSRKSRARSNDPSAIFARTSSWIENSRTSRYLNTQFNLWCTEIVHDPHSRHQRDGCSRRLLCRGAVITLQSPASPALRCGADRQAPGQSRRNGFLQRQSLFGSGSNLQAIAGSPAPSG